MYLGDFVAGGTIDFAFCTVDSTGAPAALSGGAVSVYKDSSTTQSTAGVTLTASFDSVTGLNHVTITTASDGTFYANGSQFEAVITTGTVGGVSVVGYVVGRFTLRAQAALYPTTAGNTLDVSATGEAGIDWANIGSPTTAQNFSGTYIQGVNTLATGSAAVNTVATSGSTVTTGSTVTGTYASTAALDGVYWQIADTAGTLDMYFQFNVGTGGVPTSARWTGHLTSSNDTLLVYAYNWSGAAWQQVGTLTGSNAVTDTTQTYNFTTAHVGTGSNAGIVRLRFANTGLTSSNFYTDQVLCGYTISPIGIPNGSTITLTSATTNQTFDGDAWFLVLNGQQIDSSVFKHFALVSGTATTGVATNLPVFDTGAIGTVTLPPCVLVNVGFAGTMTAGAAGDYICHNSFSQVAGSGTPTFDFSGVSGATRIQWRNYFGGSTWVFNSNCTATIEATLGGTTAITNAGGSVQVRGTLRAVALTTSGSATTTIHGMFGAITVAGTGGTLNIYGLHGDITDTSTGTTINDYGQTITNLDATILSRQATFTSDTGVTFPSNFGALAITGGGATTVGTNNDKTGYSLSASQTFNVTGNITGNVTGSVGSVTSPVTVGTNGDKTGYTLSTAGNEAAADALLGRNIAGGSNGGRTVYQAIAVLRNKIDTTSTPGTMSVYGTDDTTLLWSATLTTDAAAEPIVASDPS